MASQAAICLQVRLYIKYGVPRMAPATAAVADASASSDKGATHCNVPADHLQPPAAHRLQPLLRKPPQASHYACEEHDTLNSAASVEAATSRATGHAKLAKLVHTGKSNLMSGRSVATALLQSNPHALPNLADRNRQHLDAYLHKIHRVMTPTAGQVYGV